MATPEMLVQTFNKTVIPLSPGSLRINTFNPDGTVLDVHTGYTLNTLEGLPSGNQNVYAHAVSIASDVTPAFDATGVTLSWTGAQAGSIASAFKALNNIVYALLSNDSGTTQSVCAIGNIAIDQNANAL